MFDYEHASYGDQEGEDDERDVSPEDAIQEFIAQTESAFKESNEQYSDPSFPADDTSLYFDSMTPPKYAIDTPIVEWKRPEEIYTIDEPVMLKDGAFPTDVKQGALGDCWLLGSFSCLSVNGN